MSVLFKKHGAACIFARPSLYVWCVYGCVCRASLESLSFNASCTACRADRSQSEVIPHLRLELTNPKQTAFLYGNVTPLECAAAHGHTEAMKLLMLVSHACTQQQTDQPTHQTTSSATDRLATGAMQ